MRRAVATSHTAKVAPPSVETSPKLAIPEMRNARVGPCAATRIVSPTAKSRDCAVSWSITTSSPPDAQAPVTSRIGLNRPASGSTPKPNVGLPLELIGSPSRSSSFACVELPTMSMIVPAAASTSGSERTSATRSSSTVALPLAEKSTSFFPVTTASVCSYAELKTESKPRAIESVRTNEPVTIATPRTIAREVRRVRSLRPARPLSATLRISAPSSGGFAFRAPPETP